MTIPDPMMPYDVILHPGWNDLTARVMPGFQDASTSDSLHRVAVPRGINLLQIENGTRFSATLKSIRSGTERTVKVVGPNSEAFVKLITEVPTEMWFSLGGTPNTNDQSTTRIGVKVFPGNVESV